VKHSILLTTLVATFARIQAAEPPHAAFDEKHRVFFSENCNKCHNAEKQKGKVRLDDIPFTLDTIERADLWQKVLNAINSGDMPPEDEKQPDPAAKTEFLDSLSQTLVAARTRLSDSGGNSVMRRLNRREYKNTIRELLGVDINTSELPADGGAGAFDTVGASLFMSSDQFEQYLILGRRALDDHFASRLTASKQSSVYRLEPEILANPALEGWMKSAEETDAKFKPWAAEVDRAAAAPENAEAMVEIRKKEGVTDPNASLGYQLYYHAHLLKGAPRSEDHGLGDSFNAAFHHVQRIYYTPFHKHWLALPHRQTGAYLSVGAGYQAIRFQKPHPAQVGDYILRIRVGAVNGTAENRRFLDIGPTDQQDEAKSEIVRAWSTHQVTGSIENPQIIEVPIKITSEADLDFQIKERQPRGAGERNRFFFQQKDFVTGYGPPPVLWVDWVELEGPIERQPAFRVEAETQANPVLDDWIKTMTEQEAKFKVWAALVDQVAAAPENKEIMQQIKSEDPHVIDADPWKLYYYAERLKGAPRSQDHGLGDPANAAFTNQVRRDYFALYQHYAALPHRQTGAYLMIAHGLSRLDLKPPPPVAPGDYIMRIRAGAVKDSPADRRFIEIGPTDPEGLNWDITSVLSSHQVTGSIEEPQIIEVPIRITSDKEPKFSVRERQPRGEHNRYGFHYGRRYANGYGAEPVNWVDWVEWVGPLNTGGAEPVLFANTTNASEPDHARAVIEAFAKRAFRGKPPNAEFIEKLVGLYQARRAAGETFDNAIREPLSVLLASPGFLYLQEIGTKESGHGNHPENLHSPYRIPLSNPELASRLSYFLWSAPPDETLLATDLSKPENITKELDRMLADKKSREFVNGFVHQWLGMSRLDFFQFNNAKFRDFDESMKATARQEVYETFAHLLANNRSLKELLKSDGVMINGLLARFYGIEGVAGDEFRPVKLPAGSPRGGLLGMSAIHAMGSNGDHTSPVERGAWVLRKLLNNPPPPAPPNVPQISRLEGKLLTTRERLAAHMEEPQCAQCHRKIDPIGFGLENFDATGKWRTTDSYSKEGVGSKEWPIDPSGTVHNGPAFKDYYELRDYIASKDDDFAQGFTQALIEYALGRPYGFTDADLAASVIAKAKQKNFAMREFIQALVLSREFGRK
jgi:hypothetical protein